MLDLLKAGRILAEASLALTSEAMRDLPHGPAGFPFGDSSGPTTSYRRDWAAMSDRDSRNRLHLRDDAMSASELRGLLLPAPQAQSTGQRKKWGDIGKG